MKRNTRDNKRIRRDKAAAESLHDLLLAYPTYLVTEAYDYGRNVGREEVLQELISENPGQEIILRKAFDLGYRESYSGN